MQPAPSPADPTTGRPAEAARACPPAGADGPLWHTLGADEVLRAQQIDGQRGLGPAEVASRAQRYGPNNTNVTRGTGEFVVTATGMATEVGHISGLLAAEEVAKTPLTRQLDKLTRQILWIAGAALIVSVVLNLARGDTFTTVFTAAIAFAVGALPENLPAVVTTILAYGTQALARAGAIMKRMQSTETLGSTSAINSDKTGTLTLNQMTAVAMAVVGRRYAIEGRGYSTDGQITRVAGQAEIPLDQFLMPMVLASDAVLSDGQMIGDPTEGALVALAAKGGVDAASTRQAYPRIAELPFDAAYKLMATFHQMTDDESGIPVVRCFVKGAPDQLLARAATVYDADAGRCPPTPSSGSATWPRTSSSASRGCGSWPPRARTSTRPPSIPAPTCSPWWTAWRCWPWSGLWTRRAPLRRRPSRRPRLRASGSG